MKNKISTFFIAIILWGLVVPVFLRAEPSILPFKSKSVGIDSRSRQVVEDAGNPAFKETIKVPGANWIRLEFGEYNLGEKSYVMITSLEDGGRQRLDARSMPQWRNRSAFFNGEAVTVELFVQPGESGIFFTIKTVYYGEPGAGSVDESPAAAEDEPQPEDICGSDDRVRTIDPAVGRFVFFDVFNNMIAKCTAFIVSNGAHLTAGHCFQRADYGDPDLLEFNVPLSDANGDPNFADPDDQYPVDLSSYTRHENGRGDDWAIFACNPNSNTGLLPVQRQHDFFRMSKDSSPSTIRITGYGKDDGSDNRVLQTDTGPYLGEHGSGSRVEVEYQVDTRSGNSGGPVIIDGTETTIGIHTHGGCDPGNGEGNHGTSFENDTLEAAIQGFRGNNVVYVDVGHPISSSMEAGTVLRPYDTIPEAAAAVPDGGVISIVSGNYTKAAGNTFVLGSDGKGMLLEAPVGSVTIGN